MHGVCVVRLSPRGSSMYIQVLGEVGSLVYTQADNRYGFSPRGTYLLACDQKDTGTYLDLVVRYLDNLNQGMMSI